MYVKRLKECPEFMSADGCVLREPVHARKGDFRLDYSLAHATVKPGIRAKPHRLKTSEVYYFIEGNGVMTVGTESAEVGPGDTVYVPPHAKQYIENTGKTDLKFLCIVEPAWRPEDEEVV
jgi:mannose-6-phosphate isomerase-like protein (cupin superfamily)